MWLVLRKYVKNKIVLQSVIFVCKGNILVSFPVGIESYFAVFVLNLENEIANFPVKDSFHILCSSSAIVVDTAVLYLNFVSYICLLNA